MASVTRQYALAGRSAVAILVVHVSLRLVPAVVFRVGTDRDALGLVDSFHAVVVRQTGLQKLLGVRLRELMSVVLKPSYAKIYFVPTATCWSA